MNEILFFRRDPNAVLPIRQTPGSSGFDLHSCHDFVLRHDEITLVDTGWDIAHIPDGYELQVRPRSGLAAKHGCTIVNSPGTVDNDYRGPLKVILTKLTRFGGNVVFRSGARIAQLVLCPVEMRCSIAESDTPGNVTLRSSGGFGSTGE